MTGKEFIESGNLEAYCMGVLDASEQTFVLQMCSLYPEVRTELELIELSLEKIALQSAITPAEGNRERLLDSLFKQDVFDINHPPIADEFSDYKEWLRAYAYLIPDEPAEVFFSQLLRHDEEVIQALVISKVNIPDEVHNDLVESFFILKGSCCCTIDGTDHTLNAGDFLAIPPHKNHDVVLLTPYVVAIHQQQPLV